MSALQSVARPFGRGAGVILHRLLLAHRSPFLRPSAGARERAISTANSSPQPETITSRETLCARRVGVRSRSAVQPGGADRGPPHRLDSTGAPAPAGGRGQWGSACVPGQRSREAVAKPVQESQVLPQPCLHLFPTGEAEYPVLVHLERVEVPARSEPARPYGAEFGQGRLDGTPDPIRIERTTAVQGSLAVTAAPYT